MSFDWSEFLGVAQSLTGDPVTRVHGDEARFRAAVSRAYYAAHGIAREKLRSFGEPIPKKGVHASVIASFRNSTDRTWQKIASDLNTLFQQRLKADYQENRVIQLSAARFANQLAVRLLQDIKTI